MSTPLPETFVFTGTPYAHQREALERFWDKPAAALFHEMGTGKSYTVIHNAAALYEANEIDLLVVIAPKGVYRNWEGEIGTHWPTEAAPDVETWGVKRKKKNAKRNPGLKVFLMNVEALSTKRGEGALNAEIRGRRTMLVVDESTCVKNHKAKRTRALVLAARKTKYRRILTGSPITQSPLDLFGQISVLMPDPMGFNSYYAFRARYAEVRKVKLPGRRPFEEVKGYRRLDELQERLAPFSSRVLKEECLDLPEKIYERRAVDLTPEQTKAYAEMAGKAKTLLGGTGKVTAPQAITQILRLHQITCGFVKLDDGTDRQIKSRRLDALVETIEELGDEKVIIWAPYRRSIMEIANRLSIGWGSKCVETYFGDTTSGERQDAIDRFQNEHDCRFFVGNPQTAGYGLTLTAASNVVYYANSWKLEERMQSEDRCHRIGQTRAVTYVDLVAPGTVDERILEALISKHEIASEVLGEQWRRWIE